MTGRRLTRTADGYGITVCHTTHTNRRRSPVYLVDSTDPKRPHLSGVYGDELEIEGTRYKIVAAGEGVFLFEPVRFATKYPAQAPTPFDPSRPPESVSEGRR